MIDLTSVERVSTECAIIARALIDAKCPENIFGSDYRGVVKAYQQYAKTCHPDKFSDPDNKIINEVFVLLGDMKEAADYKISNRTYGDMLPYIKTKPYVKIDMSVKGIDFQLAELIGEGTFSTIHRAIGPKLTGFTFLKVARHHEDNDLLEREFVALREITRISKDPQREEFFAKQRIYVPVPIFSFFIKSDNGEKLRANLLGCPEGKTFTLQRLKQFHYKEDFPPKHIWWIYRRMLLTLEMAHMRGYAHCATTPDHVLVYPKEHGIILLDWTNATKIDSEKMPTVNPDYEIMYPKTILNGSKPSPWDDIHIASATILLMLEGNKDKGIAEASQWLRENVSIRGSCTAWECYRTFGTLLGKKEYVEMIVPD